MSQRNTVIASRPAKGTGAETRSNLSTRISQIRKLYATNYSNLEAAAYDSYKNLFTFDCDRILSDLATILPRYKGPIENRQFMKWASRWVSKKAKLEERHHQLIGDVCTIYRPWIMAAIQEYRWTSVIDLSVSDEDIFQEIVLVLLSKMKYELLKPSPTNAKMSTRLVGLVKSHVWLYHNSPNAYHHKRIKQQIDDQKEFGIEILSDAELASMKEDEAGYDAGDSEIGLSLQ